MAKIERSLLLAAINNRASLDQLAGLPFPRPVAGHFWASTRNAGGYPTIVVKPGATVALEINRLIISGPAMGTAGPLESRIRFLNQFELDALTMTWQTPGVGGLLLTQLQLAQALGDTGRSFIAGGYAAGFGSVNTAAEGRIARLVNNDVPFYSEAPNTSVSSTVTFDFKHPAILWGDDPSIYMGIFSTVTNSEIAVTVLGREWQLESDKY